MIQLTVTDTLQNFSNDYIYESQDDMVAALHMLFDFADYTKESLRQEVLQLQVISDRPLDISKLYYHLKRERKNPL